MDSGARHQQTAPSWGVAESADGKNRKPLNCSSRKRRRRFVISASFSINAPSAGGRDGQCHGRCQRFFGILRDSSGFSGILRDSPRFSLRFGQRISKNLGESLTWNWKSWTRDGDSLGFSEILRDSQRFSLRFGQRISKNLWESWTRDGDSLGFFEILWDSQRLLGILRDSWGFSKIFFEIRTENLQESLKIFYLELRIFGILLNTNTRPPVTIWLKYWDHNVLVYEDQNNVPFKHPKKNPPVPQLFPELLEHFWPEPPPSIKAVKSPAMACVSLSSQRVAPEEAATCSSAPSVSDFTAKRAAQVDTVLFICSTTATPSFSSKSSDSHFNQSAGGRIRTCDPPLGTFKARGSSFSILHPPPGAGDSVAGS